MTIDKLPDFASDPTASKGVENLTLTLGFPSRIKPARQWFNYLLNIAFAKTNEVIDGLSAESKQRLDDISTLQNAIQDQIDQEIGLIFICPFTSVPSNTLECNGSTYNISDYPKLFSKIGNKYGGDGTSTFAVPDYRGLFVRGLDNDKGIDSDRVLGSLQDESIKKHGHPVGYSRESGGAKDSVGYVVIDTTAPLEVHDPNTGDPTQVSGDISTNAIGGFGGPETRPKNIAAIYVIRAK